MAIRMAKNIKTIERDTASTQPGSLDLPDHLRPLNEAGTTTARMVLSALADTSKLAEGLNLSAVGGKEWACRILRRGCFCQLLNHAFWPRLTANVLASMMPRDKSEQPYARSLPLALIRVSSIRAQDP